MLWTTRMPVMFSLSAPLTMDMATRTRMNALRANGCHTAMMSTSMGMVTMEMRPSLRLSTISMTTMPASESMSPRVITTSAMNSCSWPESPWTRDIMRPTSVLS